MTEDKKPSEQKEQGETIMELIIKKAVDRFLAWPGPQGSCIDNLDSEGLMLLNGSGTNLLDTKLATEMFKHCIGDTLAEKDREIEELKSELKISQAVVAALKIEKHASALTNTKDLYNGTYFIEENKRLGSEIAELKSAKANDAKLIGSVEQDRLAMFNENKKLKDKIVLLKFNLEQEKKNTLFAAQELKKLKEKCDKFERAFRVINNEFKTLIEYVGIFLPQKHKEGES